jgi:hypothetical protein
MGLALLAVGAAGGGCVEVSGGAVELDWVVVQQHDGTVLRFCDCPAPSGWSVASLGLMLTPRTPGAARPPEYWFACSDGRGTTSFSIPPGDYDLTLRPTDAGGGNLAESLRAFPSPPVLVRRIVHGQVASLDVWTIRLDCRP